MRAFIAAVVLGLPSVSAVPTYADTALDSSPTVPTTSGLVRGKVASTTVSFLGIPYAAAPIDDLRWRPPRPPVPTPGVLDASRFGKHCPQGAALDVNASEPTAAPRRAAAGAPHPQLLPAGATPRGCRPDRTHTPTSSRRASPGPT